MLVTRPKSGIIKSTNVRSIKIIQQDRVDDLFDGYAFDILGGKKGEGNAEREKERGNTHLLTAAILPYFFEISECFLLFLFDSPCSFVPGDTLSLEPRALAAVVLG